MLGILSGEGASTRSGWPRSGAREGQRAPEPGGIPPVAKAASAAGYLSPAGASSPVSIGSSNAADQLKWGELSGAPVTGS